MRRLFEGGVTNAETLAAGGDYSLAAGGDYSRAATIRGRRLIDEIRYIVTAIVRGGKWSSLKRHFINCSTGLDNKTEKAK